MGSEEMIFKPVVSRYTNYATPAPSIVLYMTLNNLFFKTINITNFHPFIMDSFSTTCFNPLLQPSSGGLTICCTVIINLHVSIISWRKVLLFMDKLLLKLLCFHSQHTAMFQAHSKLLKGNKVIISLKLNKIGILIETCCEKKKRV
jgi:hypothetical protein